MQYQHRRHVIGYAESNQGVLEKDHAEYPLRSEGVTFDP